MHMHRVVFASVMALVVALVPQASAQNTTIEVEAGYQWVSVDGNEDMYRTQIDQDDGFVLRQFHFVTRDPDGNSIHDMLRIDASGFGGEPSGRFRLEAGLADLYRFNLSYNRYDHFSALPAFANPFVEEGVTPGQHIFDRDRESAEFSLELLPGRAISPIIGYRWNQYEGAGHTTYHVGQDEFRLLSELEETEKELYGGLTFAFGNFSGALIQGWREFDGDDHSTLIPGAGAGNNTRPVLGTDVFAESYQRQVVTEAETPVTTFRLNGRVSSSVRLRAAYMRADAESEAQSFEALSGSLASYRISRFFAGLDQDIASRTDSPSWRGDLRVSAEITDIIGLEAGYEKRHRSLDGWSMISSLFLDTMTFGGFDTGDINRMTEIRTLTERDEDRLDLRVSLNNLGALSFWADASSSSQELEIAPDLAQIIVAGGQGGEFERDISRFGFGAAVQVKGGRVSLDVSTEDADDPIVRTDFTDRLRLRMRFRLPLHEDFDLRGTAELIEFDNLDSGVGYKASTEHWGLDLGYTPIKAVTLHGVYDHYETDSSALIRQPQDFSTVATRHIESGDLFEGRIDLDLDRFMAAFGISTFENEGSFGFDFDRVFARVGVDLCKVASIAFEYETYDYSEDLFTLADFESERFAIFLIYRP